MFVFETKFRVLYGDTDRMGYVYYGNYARFYETGRVETMRKLGISYRELEDSGIMMPIISMNSKYIKPAFYDDLLNVKTYIRKMPTARIKFEYEIYNEKQELINVGETVLVFINDITRKPCVAPNILINALKNYF